MFKRSIVYLLKSDANLENNVVEFGRNHEFGDLTWYPSQRKVLYRIDDRVSMNVSGDGVNDFFGFRPIPTLLLATARVSGNEINFLCFNVSVLRFLSSM